MEDAIHVTADDRRLLVVHGDVFDAVVMHARWLALLGDGAYTATLWLNRHFNTMRRRLGYPYWSLSAYLKRRVKNAVQYITSFGEAVADEACRRGVEGVVCGHIHHAELRTIGGILYCNSGDWVESCTALVEHFDGRLEVLHWSDPTRLEPLPAHATAVTEGAPETSLPAFADALG
jgi:UDP-2,3-diacylglucosamine pyrophosphatase LpxH